MSHNTLLFPAGCRAISLVSLFLAAQAWSDDPRASLARAKVAAELGDYSAAEAALSALAEEPAVPAPLRWEAYVRLGLVRQAAGDAAGSLTAYRAVVEAFGESPDAMAFLFEALSGIAPDPQRWKPILPELRIELDDRQPHRSVATITWRGVESCEGENLDSRTLSLSSYQGPLPSFLRSLERQAEVTFEELPSCAEGLRVRVPGATRAPAGRLLRAALISLGLRCQRQGEALSISCSEAAAASRPVAEAGVATDLVFRLVLGSTEAPGPSPAAECAGARPMPPIPDAEGSLERLHSALRQHRPPPTAGRVLLCGYVDGFNEVAAFLEDLTFSPTFDRADLHSVTLSPPGYEFVASVEYRL